MERFYEERLLTLISLGHLNLNHFVFQYFNLIYNINQESKRGSAAAGTKHTGHRSQVNDLPIQKVS